MARSILILAALAATANATICGWKFGITCPEAGYTCVATLPWCQDVTRCIGQCTQAGTGNSDSNPNYYQPCGGMMPQQQACPTGDKCIPDPRIPGCGATCDGSGICVAKTIKQCGGNTGLTCASGQQCFDNPGDDCDPGDGDANCVGICLYPLPSATSTSPAQTTTSKASGVVAGQTTSVPSPTSTKHSTKTTKTKKKSQSKKTSTKSQKKHVATKTTTTQTHKPTSTSSHPKSTMTSSKHKSSTTSSHHHKSTKTVTKSSSTVTKSSSTSSSQHHKSTKTVTKGNEAHDAAQSTTAHPSVSTQAGKVREAKLRARERRSHTGHHHEHFA